MSAQPSEQELRAALEEELRRITVDEMLLQSVVSLINLAGRRSGLAGGPPEERDLEQVGTAIEAVRALLPLLERGPDAARLGPLRDALSQLQLVWARERSAGAAAVPDPGARAGAQRPPAPPGVAADAPPRGDPGAAGEAPDAAGGAQPPGSEQPGPAERSGRLWVPGR